MKRPLDRDGSRRNVAAGWDGEAPVTLPTITINTWNQIALAGHHPVPLSATWKHGWSRLKTSDMQITWLA